MKKTLFALAILACTAWMPACSRTTGSTQAAAADTAVYTLKQLPLSTTTGILDAIAAQYAGRVAVIDVWATWCGPCRMAMTAIDSIKPALMDKGVAFVYITGETSPAADFRAALPRIAGDHYRLSREQWATLCKEQKIAGIPAYVILAKDGSHAYENTGGFPGNEAIEKIVNEALKK